ncbi:ABC transporter ATP-binding protein [Haloarcula pellucida]|uniref:ABC transporter ATP-binding protein n=1 Tax=Haloarcula pellucida TaxID=1427151 RepID=A0A830GI26_9EURY|nr:ABC transporter ATP-binding protein [Halomicroarcula pellucida]MBX0347251.1 ABC transporter ATP-binding protein [Halomicroarcula pellucida]GGN87743.1 ABC transporter ATP-binding protein [Halomicroarcula pellucida]
MAAIETTGLTRRFGDVTALSNLSLTVEEGALFGLLGPNGSGKTTTIELLTGQREPTSGTARVVGRDPVTDPMGVTAAIGILPEREDPPSFLTPREYLSFVAEVRDVSDPDQRIEAWADRLEFAGILDALSTGLSEGERQRVMLAAAFLHDPDLVFIDEPLVNLDPIMQERVKRRLADYCARGNTLFLSTHYVDVAAELCTHVGIVDDGRLVAECDPRGMSEDELLEYFVAEVGDESAEVRT